MQLVCHLLTPRVMRRIVCHTEYIMFQPICSLSPTSRMLETNHIKGEQTP